MKKLEDEITRKLLCLDHIVDSALGIGEYPVNKHPAKELYFLIMRNRKNLQKYIQNNKFLYTDNSHVIEIISASSFHSIKIEKKDSRAYKHRSYCVQKIGSEIKYFIKDMIENRTILSYKKSFT